MSTRRMRKSRRSRKRKGRGKTSAQNIQNCKMYWSKDPTRCDLTANFDDKTTVKPGTNQLVDHYDYPGIIKKTMGAKVRMMRYNNEIVPGVEGEIPPNLY